MPGRRAALLIGLLSLAASAGSLTLAWFFMPEGDAAGLTGGIAVIVFAVLTAIWGLAHLIPLAFGAAFPRRPR